MEFEGTGYRFTGERMRRDAMEVNGRKQRIEREAIAQG